MFAENREKQPSFNTDTVVILERHGQYDSGLSQDINKWGWLTKDGEDSTRQTATQVVDSVLKPQGKDVDVLFLHSPSKYQHIYGARAQQTADITLEQVLSTNGEAGLKINVLKSTNGADYREEPLLRESNVSGEYLMIMEEKFGSNAWEEFYNGIAELEETRVREGIESPQEVSDRVVKFLSIMQRYSRQHHASCPDRLLAVWAFTHGDVLRCFSQYALRAGDQARNYNFSHNATLQISIDNNKKLAQCTFNNQIYSLSF